MKPNPTTLRTSAGTALLVLGLAVCALVAPAARAGDQVPFRATWVAQLAITPLTPPLVSVAGSGQGYGLHLGAMTAQSIDEVVNLATGEGLAHYRFTAANGEDVLLTFVFTAIPTSPTFFVIQGAWQVTGGTGRFEGASGSGTYAGHAEFTGPATAVGEFALQGTISSPGSLNQP